MLEFDAGRWVLIFRTLAQFKREVKRVSRIVPKLWRWESKTLRPSIILYVSSAWYSGYDCRFPVRGIPVRNLWLANFWFLFREICVQNQWGHKTLRTYLVANSDTGDPSSIAISEDRICICFSNLILWNLCEKTTLCQLNISWKFEWKQ